MTSIPMEVTRATMDSEAATRMPRPARRLNSRAWALPFIFAWRTWRARRERGRRPATQRAMGLMFILWLLCESGPTTARGSADTAW